MTQVEFRSSKVIGEGQKPYYVAELNTSHFGDLDLAKDMIEKAAEIGCDCIKLQSWTADTLYSSTYYQENPIAKRFVKKYSLSEPEIRELAGFCEETGIDFSSTPYAEREVDFLTEECGAAFVKIASMELNNLSFLDYIGKKQVPVVLSTGMGSMEEIQSAVKTIKDAGNDNLCVLHCVSIYPAPMDIVNLNNIVGLQESLPGTLIGYSDHTIGPEAASASIALGACLIEKHFTLDKSKIGMDNQMASEPDEMKALIEQCNNVFAALGSKERTLTQEERDQRDNMRRSVVTTRDIDAGEVLSLDDLTLKRPGTGIPADKLGDVVGKKLKNPVNADCLIRESDLA